jgi:hypothetical protein
MKHPRLSPNLILLALAGLLALTLIVVEPALAAGSARDVGRNVGGLLKEWAGWLFGGVTAIVAIPYLARRDVAGGLVFTLIALIVGGFVLAGPTVAQIIESIYKLAAEGK